MDKNGRRKKERNHRGTGAQRTGLKSERKWIKQITGITKAEKQDSNGLQANNQINHGYLEYHGWERILMAVEAYLCVGFVGALAFHIDLNEIEDPPSQGSFRLRTMLPRDEPALNISCDKVSDEGRSMDAQGKLAVWSLELRVH